MKKALVLTLGHNSSAIYVADGHIMAGFEEERLSGIKSDSALPIKSIQQIQKTTRCGLFDAVYIGHWFTKGELATSKYYDLEVIKQFLVPGAEIKSIDPTLLTHHDSHIEAAEVFAEAYNFKFSTKTLGLVIDGFGTYGENLTVYRYVDNNDVGYDRNVALRVFGHHNSLGLMYQYATAYLGMKMHNHEYKMLGYEAHIAEVHSDDQIEALNGLVKAAAAKRLKSMLQPGFDRDCDPIVNVEALNNTQQLIFQELDEVVNNVPMQMDEFQLRVTVSYYAQHVLEETVALLLEYVQEKIVDFDSLLLSGGVFYNVKLNQMLAEQFAKKEICVYPLAGDQGAGLGVYNFYEKNLRFPKHLYWGVRLFDQLAVEKINAYNATSDHKIIAESDLSKILQSINESLETQGFVNLVSGSMEFGPRALGATTTLAKPTVEMTELINVLNDRTFVMPMAPIMSKKHFIDLAGSADLDKVVGSLEYMITTCKLRPEKHDSIPGASHKYPGGYSTFRPQIKNYSTSVGGAWGILLDKHGPLINTSFNYHGKPIVYDIDDIILSHSKQAENAPEGVKVTTVIALNILSIDDYIGDASNKD